MSNRIIKFGNRKSNTDRTYMVIKLYRKPFNYWYPGTNAIDEIIKSYIKITKNGDFLVISEKALSIAFGNIYDENAINIDKLTYILTYILNNYVWNYLLSRHLSKKVRWLLKITPIELMARHKKLALKYGGLLHFLKPISEAGIDTKNLPYYYVSLPLMNANYIAGKIRNGFLKYGKDINVLIIDTDRTIKIKRLNGIAFSTRKSFIKGIFDIGVLGYIISKAFRRYVMIFPTPVAYQGKDVSLKSLLKIAKIANKLIGGGYGFDVYDMLHKLDKRDFSEVTWLDMNKIKHYPAVLIRIERI